MFFLDRILKPIQIPPSVLPSWELLRAAVASSHQQRGEGLNPQMQEGIFLQPSIVIY
jgi:hypothetical protein